MQAALVSVSPIHLFRTNKKAVWQLSQTAFNMIISIEIILQLRRILQFHSLLYEEQ